MDNYRRICFGSPMSARRHLSSRIDRVDSSINECKELTEATKDEVSKLHGDLSGFHEDVESVRCAVQTLETMLVSIEANQDFATKVVYSMSTMPPLAIEPSLPTASSEHVKVLHTPKAGSTSGESSGSRSSSVGFGWRISGFSSLTRVLSTAS